MFGTKGAEREVLDRNVGKLAQIEELPTIHVTGSNVGKFVL
jgi:hypothetical protein